MQKKFTKEYLEAVVNCDDFTDVDVDTIVPALAKELLRMYELKGSFIARGYIINKLSEDLNKSRSNRAFKSKQIDLLLSQVPKGTNFEITGSYLATEKNEKFDAKEGYVAAGAALNELVKRRADNAKKAKEGKAKHQQATSQKAPTLKAVANCGSGGMHLVQNTGKE